MIRRLLMFRGTPDYQRAPDSQRAPDDKRALMLREPLICIGP